MWLRYAVMSGCIRWAFNSRTWHPKQSEWTLATQCVQPEEKERIGKFYFRRDAKASMVGRLMIRKVVHIMTGIPYKEIQLGRTDKGKPYIMNDLPWQCRLFEFNVSHQGEYVVLAAEAECLVGIDIMKLDTPNILGLEMSVHKGQVVSGVFPTELSFATMGALASRILKFCVQVVGSQKQRLFWQAYGCRRPHYLVSQPLEVIEVTPLVGGRSQEVFRFINNTIFSCKLKSVLLRENSGKKLSPTTNNIDPNLPSQNVLSDQGSTPVPDFLHTMRRQFTLEEMNLIKSSDEEAQQLRTFYRLWCLKESYVKALGIGIGFEVKRLNFDLVTLVLQENNIVTDTTLRVDGELQAGWKFEEYIVDNHCIAVARKSKNNTPLTQEANKFKMLTFPELVDGAVPLSEPDLNYWESFRTKSEDQFQTNQR